MRRFFPVLFFICFFAFLLVHIDPAVIYSSNGIDIHNYVATMHAREAFPQHADVFPTPAFRRHFILELTPEYLREIAIAPGGWTRLAVTLCIYACHYPVAGALVITGLALFFFLIFPLYVLGIGVRRRPFVLGLVPPFFLLTICAWYELSYCMYLLPVAGALVAALFYRRLRPAGTIARLLLLSLFFWSTWYLMQWGCLLFLVFAAIHELFNRDRRSASIMIAAVLNAAILCALDAWVVPLTMTIRWGDFTAASGLPLAAIGFFPLSAIVQATWGRFRRAPARGTTSLYAVIRASALLCGIVGAALWLVKEPVNRDTRTIARTMHHVMNGQWEAVLHEKSSGLFKNFPRKAGPLQAFMAHSVDHALCRTGHLGDRLFAYPQAVFSEDPLFLLETTHTNGYVNWVVVLELAMDLGMVNTAEKIAGEIMENVGPYPDFIYRRALVQLAKGNDEAAAVYLNKLAGMPFYRTEAKRLLGMVGDDAAQLFEPRIAAMRANMDTTDYFLFTVSYDAMLKHLLQSNTGNKAAYDYLMTFCLLTGRPQGLVALVPAAPAFGYAVLPRYWEEALCVYRAANAQQSSSGASFSGLRPETVERFNEFARRCLQMADDPAAAEKLAPEFGDSYYYFSIFRHSKGVLRE